MPIITDVLTVPISGSAFRAQLPTREPTSGAVDLTVALTDSGTAPSRSQALSVGLVLDGREVKWGDCVPSADRRAPFLAAEGIASVRDVVAPALIGRSITTFRALDEAMESLREHVTVERSPLPSPPTHDLLSRRDLLAAPWRALRDRKDAPPEVERIEVERELDPAVRYGVSQAILAAVAAASHRSPAEVLADEWHLPQPGAPIPIHAISGEVDLGGARQMVSRGVASLSYRYAGDPREQLGEQNQKLVRRVRELSDTIVQTETAGYRPVIHLDLCGGLGTLFGDNLGQILGALRGLELAARPCGLRIEDPLIAADRETHIVQLHKLRDYIRIRRMEVALVVGAWIDGPEAVRAFIAGQAADMIEICMPAFGGIARSIEALLLCHASGVGALLGGSPTDTDLSARMPAQVALACRPDLLSTGPGDNAEGAICLMQDEMARTLAEIEFRRRRGPAGN